MALYLDIHRHVSGATADDIADAHQADLAAQWRFGVRFRAYWFSIGGGTLFCLLDAPDSETARAVHRSSHGLLADEIFEVVGAGRGASGGDDESERPPYSQSRLETS